MSQQRKLKLIISSFKERELLQFFELYSQCFLQNLSKNTKKISYNCYETHLEYANISFNGYGKNSNESLASAAINLILKLIQNEQHQVDLKQCIKRFSTAGNAQSKYTQKVKTLPDAPSQAKIKPKSIQNSLKPKENPIKAVKSIKQEIFESLNHNNIQLKQGGISSNNAKMNRVPSFSQMDSSFNFGNDNQLSQVLAKIKVLEEKLADAYEQNEYLKNRLRQKGKEEKVFQKVSSAAKIDTSFVDNHHSMKHSCLQQISLKLNNTGHTNKLEKHEPKIRSYSVSNNTSNFSSKNAPKVKIPKLNLQMLPNYHGKSNKSLNQSLLQNYQKKTKIHI